MMKGFGCLYALSVVSKEVFREVRYNIRIRFKVWKH